MINCEGELVDIGTYFVPTGCRRSRLIRPIVEAPECESGRNSGYDSFVKLAFVRLHCLELSRPTEAMTLSLFADSENLFNAIEKFPEIEEKLADEQVALFLDCESALPPTHSPAHSKLFLDASEDT